MMKAIRVALGDDDVNVSDCKPSNDCAVNMQNRTTDGVRIVCFMTDGYVGNDMEIVSAIQKHPEARVFSFGIGTAVNRFLLDKMAEAGRGEAEYVLNAEEAPTAADRFYERVHTPVLTDISIDWHGLPVTDVFPQKALDLFTAKPLVLTGRYSQPAQGMITLRGKRAGKPFEREIKVNLPLNSDANQALAQLWARKKIDDVMSSDWLGIQQGNPNAKVKDTITQLGLDYRLMTQYTSFVAVEEQTVVEGGKARTIQVPVEIPQGVNPETAVGRGDASTNFAYQAAGGLVGRSLAKSQPYGASQTVEVVSEAPMLGRTASLDAAASADKKKYEDLSLKLHRDLLETYNCWNAKRGNCVGIKDGKVKVEVWLDRSLTRTEMEQLFAAGLQPEQSKNAVFAAKLASVRGVIEVDKLPALAKLPGVRLVSLAR
jgi:Ca-activated chloride channel family protein